MRARRQRSEADASDAVNESHALYAANAVDGVPLLLRDVVGYSLARLGIRGDPQLDKTGSARGAPLAHPPDVWSYHHVKIFDEAGGRRGDAACSSASALPAAGASSWLTSPLPRNSSLFPLN